MKIVVDWFRIGLDSNFHGLEEYARILEDQIERLTNAERQRIRRISDEVEWQIAWDEHRWLFEMVLPRTLRYSCIVSLFTTLETAMNSLCQELRSRKGLRLSVRELKAEPFERTLIYIKKVAGIDIPDPPFTVVLQSLNKVRNCIVHTGGNLEEYSDPKGIKQHVGKLKGLSISHDGYIEVSKGACQELVQSAYKWIDCLCEACGLGRKNPDVGVGQLELKGCNETARWCKAGRGSITVTLRHRYCHSGGVLCPNGSTLMHEKRGLDPMLFT